MEPYVKVYGWMLELGLNARELNALAVIVSFWESGKWFQGSASYLGKWMGTDCAKTVLRTLSSLTRKGIVEKRERWEKGQKLCDYRPGTKCPGGTDKTSLGARDKMSLHNSRPDNNRDNSKEIKNKERVHQPVDEFVRRHRR